MAETELNQIDISAKETKNPDLHYIRAVQKEGDNDSFQTLVERHTPLYHSVCKKYLPILLASGVNIQDIYNDKEYIFLNSISSYDPDENTKFSTWLANQTRYYCLNTINKKVKEQNVSLEEIKEINIEQKEEPYNKDTYNHAMFILNQLKDKRICRIFKLMFLGKRKLTLSEVGEKMDLSGQGVRNLLHKGLNILRTKMDSNVCFDCV